MNKTRHGEASLLSALSPEKRREAGRAAAKDAKEGTTHFFDDFLEDNLKADRDEAERRDLQVGDATSPEKEIPAGPDSAPLRSMTPEQRKAAGRTAAKEAIEADPQLLEDLDPAIEDGEPGTGSSPNVIRFTSTKPDANGLTPQQRKELGKKHARAGISHSGSGR